MDLKLNKQSNINLNNQAAVAKCCQVLIIFDKSRLYPHMVWSMFLFVYAKAEVFLPRYIVMIN